MNNALGFDKWEYHLRNSDWHEAELISEEIPKTAFTCKSDMRFQIVHYVEPLESTTFGEWSKGLPDPTCFLCFVDLRISGATVERLQFAHLDQFRYLVPIPKLKVTNGDIGSSPSVDRYYYDSNSLEFLVGKVIGRFSVDRSFEGFARRQSIEIVTVPL